MERKPSLIQYYWYELKWAFATTLDWTRLLFKDRRVAMAQLREGLKSEHFRERTRGWTRVTSFTYGRLRVTAPIIVGCAVGLYCGFMQSSLLMALVFGFMAGIFTSLALRALPFAMLASVPLLAFLLIRSILPANVPDLPAELVAKLQSEEREGSSQEERVLPQATGLPATDMAAGHEATGQGAKVLDRIFTQERADPLARENWRKSNGEMLAQFEEEDWSLLERIFLSDGSVVLQDPADIEKVAKWVDGVRNGYERVTALQEELETLSSLGNYVDLKVLFELGLLDSATFRTVSDFERVPGKSTNLDNLFISQKFAAPGEIGIFMDDYVDPTDVVPKPGPGQERFISPRGAGYLISSPDKLTRVPSPSLMSDVCHQIVTTYVKNTGDSEMMKQWMVLEQTEPNPRPLQGGIDLREIENQILARSVRDTAAQALARRYAAIKQVELEYEDYIALQQPIAYLVRVTLNAAHESVVRAYNAEMEDVRAREAAYNGNSFEVLKTRDAPSKTKDQRRQELAKWIQDAVPQERLDR